MANQSTYVGIVPRTIIIGGAAVARGLRVTRAAGVCTVSAIGVRGDFVLMTDGEAGKPAEAAAIQGGGKLAVVASEAAAVDDIAYSAAVGQVSKTAGGGAILLGKWTQAASGAGILGEIELANPA